MSYRNPQQYIDTQSMQIQQNLQRTLSGVGTKLVSDVNKIHKENAKKVEEIRAAADTRVEKAQNSIIQTQSKNPTADFGDLQPQLSRMNAILLKDPTKRTAKEKSFVTSMSSIGDTMANSLKNTAMAQEAMLEQVNKIPGTPGAIAADEDPELYAKLSVLANRTPGRTVAKYKTNENGQVVFSMDVYGEINGKEKFLGNIINDNVSTTQMPGIIPDITKDMSSSIKQTINSEDFTSKFGAFINEQGAMVFTKDGKSKGAKVTEEYFKKQLKPNAKNILLGLTPREKTRLYNNTLDKGDKADFDYNESWNNDKQSLIEEALMNSLIRETKETYPIFAKTVDLTEKKGSNKIGKASELEERSAKEAKKFTKLQKWDGVKNPPVTTISSAINKDIQARWVGEETIDGEKFPGEWVIEQKDGAKRKILARYNSTDYQRLADQLGFEFTGEKNKIAKPEGTGPVQIGFAGPSPESKERLKINGVAKEAVIDYSQFEE